MKNKTKKKSPPVNLRIEPFEQYTDKYEEWFDKNHFAYLSELEGVKSLLPMGKGIEIGVGTGRFAEPLGIEFGVDPSLSMIKAARKRKIKVIVGTGEYLPITDNSFDFALITTTLCFLENVEKTLKEIKRILKKNGSIILAFIDKESYLGKIYVKKKGKNPFYKTADFYSTKEVTEKLEKAGFSNPEIKQTLFTFPKKFKNTEDIKDGYGEGGFIIIRTRKSQEG
jgi:ubiquinone/menaquinone biosynthesis C-methylase UbiE